MSAPRTHVYPHKRLDEVVEFLDDMRRDLDADERRPGPYPYYGATGQQGTVDSYLFDEPLLLLTQDLRGLRASGEPLARLIEGKTWVSTEIHVLRPQAQILGQFLCRVLQAIDIDTARKAASRSRLTLAHAARIRVPVPPIDEQRKIAALLEQADRLRSARRDTAAQLDAFLRTYFLERFGDPQSNSRRWPQLALGALGTNEDALRSANASPGPGFALYGPVESIQVTSEPRFDGERLLVDADGVNLVARLDAVTRVVYGRFGVNDHAHVIAANGLADLHYLRYALELIELKPFVTKHARPKLTRSSLERIPVPLPPLEQQRAFRVLVEKARGVQALQAQSRARLDELYRSLRLRALAGEPLTADR